MKKLLSLCFITAMSMVLVSCATGYGKSSFFSNGGYKDTKLSENTYKVEFTGNEITSTQATYEYAMWRGAEIAKSQGYEYFDVLDKKVMTKDASYDTRYGMRTMIVPVTELKIKLSHAKNANSYATQHVLARIN
jgi:hypothetical protein